MSLKSVLLYYFILPLVFFAIGSEFWVRHKGYVNEGSDRIPHPYIEMGGFYKGGYFPDNFSYEESPQAFGYKPKSWLKIPSYEYGTIVKSASERGKFLYRDRANLVQNPKTKNEVRIFILGGSSAYGEGATSPEKRWFVELERILRNKLKKNIVVIPAANHSHVTTQERIIYDLYVSPFEPDIVIFLDGFNDANTGISATRPGDPFGQSIIYKRNFSPFYSWLNDISKHSAAVRYLIQETVMRAWFSKTYSDNENSAQALSVASVYFDNLKHLNRRCSLEKIKCFFLLQPFWEMTEYRRKNKSLSQDLVTLNYIEILKQIENFSFIADFTNVFDTEPAEIPFIDPAHFNDAGHTILAEKVAEYIIAKGGFK